MRVTVLIASALLLTGCATSSPKHVDGALVHVVLVWLKEPGNTTHRRQLIEASKTLSVIEGVTAVRTGVSLASERSVVDDSFDVGIYVELASKEALAIYAGHPHHKAILKETIGPLTERYIVYDFTIE